MLQGDLALELGWSIAQLRQMSEREFRFWLAYRSQKMMPARRMEVYLAQIALMIARHLGGSEATIDDYMIQDRRPEKMTASAGAEAISMLTNGPGIVKLGQKRKRPDVQ